MSEDQGDNNQGKPKPRRKRAPAHFKPGGTALVQNLLSGANDVAGRSFLGGGGAGASQTSNLTSLGAPELTPVLPQASVPVPTSPQPELAPEPQPETEPAQDKAAEPQPENKAVQDKPAQDKAAQDESAEPQPENEAAQDESAEPQPESKTAERTTAGRVRRSRSHWAHKAIHESYADAKLRSATWQSHGFRIAPHVLSQLKKRLNADRRSTGNSGLALGHYVDAALRHVPPSVDEQISMAEVFGESQLWDTDKTQPSTYRVGAEAYELASNLKLSLQEAAFGRRGTQVVSAAIERLLDALEAEGPLQRPERRRPER
ncbi:hypothetical protein [Streptomyces cinereoruber]|uniref:hypothetical protein n=1 Tax=Streptomyces cinereoruber TaxID=67260 RepID=UPI0036309875